MTGEGVGNRQGAAWHAVRRGAAASPLRLAPWGLGTVRGRHPSTRARDCPGKRWRRRLPCRDSPAAARLWCRRPWPPGLPSPGPTPSPHPGGPWLALPTRTPHPLAVLGAGGVVVGVAAGGVGVGAGGCGGCRCWGWWAVAVGVAVVGVVWFCAGAGLPLFLPAAWRVAPARGSPGRRGWWWGGVGLGVAGVVVLGGVGAAAGVLGMGSVE